MERLPVLPHTPAETEIRRRISADGPIAFDEFMAVALYWPDGGYYTTGAAFGVEGDFFTSPLAHPVFGALLARQIEDMWRRAREPDPWWVVEIGAGQGRLAADVMSAVEGSPVAGAMRYLAIDRSRPGTPIASVSWAQSSSIPLRGFNGVVLANELFDAMPVHRVTVADGALTEVRVGVDGEDQFVDVLSTPSDGLAERFATLGVTLPEGYRTEICLEYDAWMASAGKAMDVGYLLLIDYGHAAKVYYDATRARGLLRTYYKHTLGMNPYLHVGRQDISVHVETTSLRWAAADAGFTEVGATTQAELLRSLGFDAYRADIAKRVDLPRPVRAANHRAIDMLVDGDGLGAFKVLVFAKRASGEGLSGLTGVAPEISVAAPIATAEHMPFGGVTEESVEMPEWGDLLS